MAKNTSNVFPEDSSVGLLNVPSVGEKSRARKSRSPVLVSVTYDSVGLAPPADFTKFQMQTLSRILSDDLRDVVVDKANYLIGEIRNSSLFSNR